MPRNAHHHADGLSRDAGDLRQVASAMTSLLALINHKAREASDAATMSALLKLGEALTDTAGDYWQGVMAAHEAATDEVGLQALYELDAETALAFHMPLPNDLPSEALSAAVEDVTRRFQVVGGR